MQPVITADEMKQCDRVAMRVYGIPGILLMEQAGAAVAEYVRGMLGSVEGKSILVVCGKGNNGGDGFVAARHLANWGAKVEVLIAATSGQLSGDAKRHFAILEKLCRSIKDRLSIHFISKKTGKLPGCDIIVDALLGTGVTGEAREPYGSLIRAMNAAGVSIVAVDIPSGVDATTGRGTNAVRATATVTFGAIKTGLLCNEGRDLTGRIEVADIGIPPAAYESVGIKTFLVHASDVGRILPTRPSTAHKYSVGKVLVVAGSRGYTGAAALATMAALRAGAGAVMLLTPESVYPILARKLTEAIVHPLPATEEGTLSLKGIEALKERILWADVTILGPGLSRNRETQQVIRDLVQSTRANILVDADGLNAVDMQLLRRAKGVFILTPHAGECARLIGSTSREVETNRVAVVRDCAHNSNSVIVLKGAPTATATSEGKVYLNTTGNPGMATVGSGDVLAGVIAALWAQGMPPYQAAMSGVFVHGRAGDLAAQQLGERSIVAQDLVDFLPMAMQSIERGGGN